MEVKVGKSYVTTNYYLFKVISITPKRKYAELLTISGGSIPAFSYGEGRHLLSRFEPFAVAEIPNSVFDKLYERVKKFEKNLEEVCTEEIFEEPKLEVGYCYHIEWPSIHRIVSVTKGEKYTTAEEEIILRFPLNSEIGFVRERAQYRKTSIAWRLSPLSYDKINRMHHIQLNTINSIREQYIRKKTDSF